MATKKPVNPRFSYKSDRLKPLRAFCQTVRLGSVSRASEALFVSQPAVSLQLQALERELGVVLFERSGRRLVPSREGQLLYEMAQPLVESLDGLEASFRDKVRGLDATGFGDQLQDLFLKLVDLQTTCLFSQLLCTVNSPRVAGTSGRQCIHITIFAQHLAVIVSVVSVSYG